MSDNIGVRLSSKRQRVRSPGIRRLRRIDRGKGWQHVDQFGQFRAVHAWLPLSQIENLARRTDVKSIRPAAHARAKVDAVTSEGEKVHATDHARTQIAVAGAGAKITMLSDSVDHMAEARASGDVGTVSVLPGQAGTGEGEGTAMLEIAHNLTQAADRFDATGFGSPSALAQNIRDRRFQYHRTSSSMKSPFLMNRHFKTV